jgi:hypothetical protein
MLNEARHELEDFVQSSKELEEELLRELERTEKIQKDLKDKVSRAETDRDDWKVRLVHFLDCLRGRMYLTLMISQNKYIQLQTTHNTTSNSLNRELDTLRKEHQALKIQLRDLEMGNDDLERTERAISVSLADIEAKYARVLEEKIILEQELLNKAKVEEEAQRLRDDMRDANSEIQVLRDQLDQFKSNQSRNSLMTPPTTDSSCSPRHDNSSMINLPSATADDQLLDTVAPADVLLDDGVPATAPPLSRPLSIASSSESTKDQPEKKPIFPRPGFTRSSVSTGLHSRSNSLRASPSKGAASLPRGPRISAPRTSGAGSQLPVSRSKGVQMVSEMRAKVRSLEQKLHTRVPRLRSGTFDRGLFGGSSPNTAAKKPVQPDSPGWVLVMEESPPPRRVTAPRRTNSPPPTAFPRLSSSTSGNVSSDAESATVYRLPGPRRSYTKSVASSTTSIPTPSTSRPSSPEFNPPTPVESRSFNALKRTSVPVFAGRASLNSSTDSRDGGLNSSQRSTSTLRGQGAMAPPPVPAVKPLSVSQLGSRPGPGPRGLSVSTMGNLSLRQSQRSAASLGASRIGRPLSMSARRTDTGPSARSLPVDEHGMVIPPGKPRSHRSGSVTQFGAAGETF